MMDHEDIYEKAHKKVQAKKGFFYHFVAYAFVIGMLYTIIYFENGDDVLPIVIVALSWGIGVAIHYFRTFGTEHLGFLGISTDWEEDELEKEVERLERKRELRERIMDEERLLDDYEELELKEYEKRPLRDER